ncbi:MFS transporter [Gordonia sp. NPDC003376]
MTQSPAGDRPDLAMIRRATITGMIGTVIEWFDFMVFALMASTVFNTLFFSNLDPMPAMIASLGTFAAGFLARPIGGVILGHFGDRHGRRPMLVASMVIMGAATLLIGLLPTYATVGAAAPILLVALRIVQGIALGGEWSGATTLILEHAPKGRRAFYASFVAYASGIGFLTGLGFTLALRSALSPEEFLAWGWRVPFIASVILVGIALYLRTRVDETSVFEKVADADVATDLPLLATLRDQWRTVLRIIGMRAGTAAVAQIVATFMLSYAVLQLDMTTNAMMGCIAVAYIIILATGWTFGLLADRFGRRRVFTAGCVLLIVGAFPMFWLVDTGTSALVTVGLLIGLTSQYLCNQTEAAWLAELFPPEVRCTGVNLAYQICVALVGGTAPMVAVLLLETGHGSWPIAATLVVLGVISLLCTLTARETVRDDDLGPEPAEPVPADPSSAAPHIHSVTR